MSPDFAREAGSELKIEDGRRKTEDQPLRPPSSIRLRSSVFGLPSFSPPEREKAAIPKGSRPDVESCPAGATHTVIGTLRPTERRRAITTRTTEISKSHTTCKQVELRGIEPLTSVVRGQ